LFKIFSGRRAVALSWRDRDQPVLHAHGAHEQHDRGKGTYVEFIVDGGPAAI